MENQLAWESLMLLMQILGAIHYQTQFAALLPEGVGPHRDFKFASDNLRL